MDYCQSPETDQGLQGYDSYMQQLDMPSYLLQDHLSRDQYIFGDSPEFAPSLYEPMEVGSTSSSGDSQIDASTPPRLNRREQNRIAQRNLRLRKEQHIAKVKRQIADLEQRKTTLQSDNEHLRSCIHRKRVENGILCNALCVDPFTSSRDDLLLTEGEEIASISSKRSRADGTDKSNPRRKSEDEVNQPVQQRPNARGLPINSLMEVYEKFADVWKTVCDQPAVRSGKVETATIMGQLMEFARYEEQSSQKSSEAKRLEKMTAERLVA